MDQQKADLTNGAEKSPTPNHGASVPDTTVLGPDSQSQTDWQKALAVDRSKQVKIVKLAHMRYQHPDLDVITTFLRDFGFEITKQTESQRWFRGYGPDHYCYYAQKGEMKFLGGTFEVESYDELEKVLRIEGAEPVSKGIEKLSDAPGGGYMATIKDPEGFLVNFIYGQAPGEPGKMPEKLLVNDETTKPRVRKFQRFEPGPAAIHKLGHFGLVVRDFDAQMAFYCKNFNIVPSDLLYVPDDSSPSAKKIVALFGHIDRGKDPVDHHSMFLASMTPGSEGPHVHHCSFEIHDFDTQLLGHQWLSAKKYKNVWGVGRHILGSQIFDYWWDTTGFMIEHYADGDLVNEETPVGYLTAADEALAVWGPDVPKEFLD